MTTDNISDNISDSNGIDFPDAVIISLLPESEGLSTSWPVIFAGTILVILPIVVLYLLLQTFQKAGIMAGAVKG